MNPQRTLLMSLMLLLTSLAYGQMKPTGFAYQTVIMRDKAPLINTSVELVATLHTPGNTPVWREVLKTRTDASGLVSINIGVRNTLQNGTTQFSRIDFGAAHLGLKVEVTNPFQLVISDEPLQTVPYARYAKNSSTAIPAGTIVAFGGDSVKIPNGWRLCNGSSLPADGIDPATGTPYARLFNAIGYNWGRGTGANTFRLPDLRGMFLRGVDQGSGRDPDAGNRYALYPGGATGDRVGSYQRDTVGNHMHDIQITPVSVTVSNPGVSDIVRMDNPGSGLPISTAPNGFLGKETRPKNAYVLYIIKL